MVDVVNESVSVISGVGESVNPFISKLIVAALILLIGLIIGKLVGTLTKRALNEVRLDKYLRSAGLRLSVEKALGKLVSYIIYLIAIVLCLDKLGLTTAILTIIIAIVLVLIAVSFLLAVKDFFPNLLAGMRIKVKKLFGEGDDIQIREVKGKIISLGLLETKIKTQYKEEVIIPNAVFNKRQVIVKRKAVNQKKK